MTGGMPVLSGLGAAFILLFFCRCLLGRRGKPAAMEQGAGIGMAQTTGSRQMQADVAEPGRNNGGISGRDRQRQYRCSLCKDRGGRHS